MSFLAILVIISFFLFEKSINLCRNELRKEQFCRIQHTLFLNLCSKENGLILANSDSFGRAINLSLLCKFVPLNMIPGSYC